MALEAPCEDKTPGALCVLASARFSFQGSRGSSTARKVVDFVQKHGRYI